MTDERVELVTPDHMLSEAKMHMLRGLEPSCWNDWAKIMNFIAYNSPSECAGQVCRIMKTIYDMPLSDEEIEAIVLFQDAKRGP